jgi:hypothetical protein
MKMPTVDERYPQKGYFSAKNWSEADDLVLEIAYVAYDEHIGSSKFRDVIHFANDGRALPLIDATARAIAKIHGKEMDDWRGKTISLFLDPDVEYEGKKTGGIRVREQAPTQTTVGGNGTETARTAQPPASFDDEIPF